MHPGKRNKSLLLVRLEPGTFIFTIQWPIGHQRLYCGLKKVATLERVPTSSNFLYKVITRMSAHSGVNKLIEFESTALSTMHI